MEIYFTVFIIHIIQASDINIGIGQLSYSVSTQILLQIPCFHLVRPQICDNFSDFRIFYMQN